MAIDAFLKLVGDSDPIKGECMDKLFPGLIELSSFSLDAQKDATGRMEGQGGLSPIARNHAQTPEMQLPNIQTELDPSSPDRQIGKDAFGFKITKDMDVSSRYLLQNYCFTWRGDSNPFKEAFVYFRKGGYARAQGLTGENASFLILHFTKPYVYEYQMETDESSSIPKETVKFYFENFTMTYARQLETGQLASGQGGKLTLGWNFNENTEL